MAVRPDLRIGDSDREAVARDLREHYAEGRLTLEEFNQRLDATFAATTQGQLSQITRDLPHVGMPAAGRPVATAARVVSVPGSAAGPLPARPAPAAVIIALMAALLLVGPHLGLFWPGGLVICVAVFAAVRADGCSGRLRAHEAVTAQAKRWHGGASSRHGPWYSRGPAAAGPGTSRGSYSRGPARPRPRTR